MLVTMFAVMLKLLCSVLCFLFAAVVMISRRSAVGMLTTAASIFAVVIGIWWVL